MATSRLVVALALLAQPGNAYLSPVARARLPARTPQLRLNTDSYLSQLAPKVELSAAAVEEAEAVEVVAVEPVAPAEPVIIETPAAAAEEEAAPAAPAAAPAPAAAAANVNTAGIAVQDFGALAFKKNAGQKYAAISGFLGVVPELPRPALLDGTHAGDYGFDPAGFVTTKEELYTQMEAEVRHCRLAMLCAAGWPLSELNGPGFFDGYFLADGGRAPSVLNGGLFDTLPPLPLAAVVAFFGFVGVRELNTLGRLKQLSLYGHVHKQDFEEIEGEWPWGVAGDDDFDPLGLYGLLGNDAVGRHCMRELELNHGRVAMLAVLGYVMIEAATHTPVTALTPFLFGRWFW